MSNKKCVFSRKIAILGRFSVINVSSNVILYRQAAWQLISAARHGAPCDSPAGRVSGGMRKRAASPPHHCRSRVPACALVSVIGEDGDFRQSPFEMVIRTLQIVVTV
jgi:hypothetical protein